MMSKLLNAKPFLIGDIKIVYALSNIKQYPEIEHNEYHNYKVLFIYNKAGGLTPFHSNKDDGYSAFKLMDFNDIKQEILWRL